MSTNWGAPGMTTMPPDQAPEPATDASQRLDKPIGDWGKPLNYDYTETDVDRVWGSNAAVYEWDGDEGDVGPENPALEIALFGHPDERFTPGLDFSKIAEINVSQEGEERIVPIFKFKDAGLHPVMLKNVEMAGYTTPTPIQRYCIPAIKMGYDLIAIAQTGSGKTAAYLVPVLNHLMGKAKKFAAPRPSPQDFKDEKVSLMRAEPLVLIICPTRELAVQIFDEARKFCYRTMLRPCVVYGGGPLSEQLNQIGKGCDLLIATPGRLIDIMQRPRVLSLRRLKFMVVDEADEMMDTDWSEDIEKIFLGGEQESGMVKYMLFSATFPAAVRKLAKTHLALNHLRVRVGRIGSTHANIKQDVVFVRQELKREALLDLLYSMKPGRTIIFVNNKRTADELDDFLFHKQLPCTSMHSDRTQREREDAMRAFRAGKSPVLVATGVSARGIDVRNVVHVINYDLPSADHGGIQEYVHRIGRTGRIGYKGLATSFYTERDEPLAESITKMLMETQQPVPDFLQKYIPEGVDPKNFKFEDDNSDDEAGWDEQPTGGDGGWDAGTARESNKIIWIDGKATIPGESGSSKAKATVNSTPSSPEAASSGQAEPVAGEVTWGTEAQDANTPWDGEVAW